jgi:transposase
MAETASVLRRLGMSAWSIAQRLGVSDKTVSKALRRLQEER